ncbi:MAG: 5'-3' exonuclease H3TH domain-containing protein [bacterium]|nr:5'-3' exonuclease H3TH domain-containing protein [bacterium]
MNEKNKLVVIDSNSVIHRAFHALPPLTTKAGVGVSAVYGFLLVFLKIIRELQPTYIAACFDVPKPTFRHQKFKGYKAKRPPTPKDIKEQIPLVKEFLEKFRVPSFEKEGFEADDLIGTICELAGESNLDLETVILSGDLDGLQLVNPSTKAYFLRRGVKDTVLYDEEKVKERYQGLVPSQLVDFKALRGDPSDNVPGVPGIGEKTAIKLIKEYGSLESLYKKILNPKIKIPNTLREKLLQNKDKAFLSQELVKIEKNVPIDFDLEKCRWGKYDKEEVVKIFQEFEFHSLINKLPETQKSSSDNNLRLW